MTDPLHESLDEALYEMQQEVGNLPRDSANPYFNSNFSSFPAIRTLVDPIAWKHGLLVKQALSFDGENDILLNTLYFNHEPAEATTIRMHLASNTPQNHGSAISFYRRYAYTTCLGLVSDQDDDGNAASRASEKQATIHAEPPVRPSKPLKEKAEAIAADHAPQPKQGEIDADF